jgi:hypothetical protein
MAIRESVKKKLPDAGELVLIINKEGDASTARYSEDGFAVDFWAISNIEVTHWRHIELK